MAQPIADMLCPKNKDKKSESNSQLKNVNPSEIVSCVRRTKIKNLKAIHNDYNSTCLAAFRTGEGLLRYGICVPCSKRLPGVRDAFSDVTRAQNRLLGHRRDIRYQKSPSTVRGGVSCVPEKASWCTE